MKHRNVTVFPVARSRNLQAQMGSLRYPILLVGLQEVLGLWESRNREGGEKYADAAENSGQDKGK